MLLGGLVMLWLAPLVNSLTVNPKIQLAKSIVETALVNAKVEMPTAPSETLCSSVVSVSENDTIEVFVVGGEGGNSVYHAKKDENSRNFSNWKSLGGGIQGGPVVARTEDGLLHVFVVGEDHTVFHKEQNETGSWGNWGSISGPNTLFAEPPTAIVSSEGALNLFARDIHGEIMHIRQHANLSKIGVPDTSWAMQTSLGGKGWTSGRPVITLDAEGLMQLFVLSVGHEVWHLAQYGWKASENSTETEVRWAAEWVNLKGYMMHGGLGVPVLSASNLIVLAALGTDKGIWIKQQKEASHPNCELKWEDWKPLGGVLKGAPVMGLDPDGRLSVMALGMGDNLFYKEQTTELYAGGYAKWSKWAFFAKSHGKAGQPTVARHSDGALAVFVANEVPFSPALNIWYKQQRFNSGINSYKWQDWAMVSSSIGAKAFPC